MKPPLTPPQLTTQVSPGCATHNPKGCTYERVRAYIHTCNQWLQITVICSETRRRMQWQGKRLTPKPLSPCTDMQSVQQSAWAWPDNPSYEFAGPRQRRSSLDHHSGRHHHCQGNAAVLGDRNWSQNRSQGLDFLDRWITPSRGRVGVAAVCNHANQLKFHHWYLRTSPMENFDTGLWVIGHSLDVTIDTRDTLQRHGQKTVAVISDSQTASQRALHLLLATSLGKPPAVQIGIWKMVQFGFRPVQKPVPLLLGRPKLDQYPSTHVFRRIWLLQSGPIRNSACQIVLLMVAFQYTDVNRKTLTIVRHCFFWM